MIDLFIFTVSQFRISANCHDYFVATLGFVKTELQNGGKVVFEADVHQ